MTSQKPITPFGRRTAQILLDIKAVLFNIEKPFIFTSGWASPVYIDGRKLISFPKERREIITMLAQTIKENSGNATFDAVAGGETAGIPYAAWLSDAMDLPMLYVRKQPKGFGRMAQIEGDMKEGQRVLLVEDLATDGGSKIKFVEVLRQAGATVEHTAVVFHYGIYPSSERNMSKLGVKLYALCTWWDMLTFVKEQKYCDARTVEEIEKFLNDPEGWSVAHGGSSGNKVA